jgi:hypothetical protein
MDVPFSTGCAATCGVAATIGPRREENAKALRPNGADDEATVKPSAASAGWCRSPELTPSGPAHRRCEDCVFAYPNVLTSTRFFSP